MHTRPPPAAALLSRSAAGSPPRHYSAYPSPAGRPADVYAAVSAGPRPPPPPSAAYYTGSAGAVVGHPPAPQPLHSATPLAPHYAGGLYYPPTQPVPTDHPDHLRHLTVMKADASAGTLSAGFDAACGRMAEIGHGRALAARYDTHRLGERHAALGDSVRNATAATTAGHHLMNRATGIVDGCTYRTRYSPSSAYGPCGPYGTTADYTSPYVAGILHQR
eukprot:TRINITY_DN8484_c0_g1_i1.p1 TRINITY_DN8484_c0_g1~~TRINITY_DN8484_c0_g1_i1.p1  ORF type:complete len:219 (+),score=28.10 TRINITY_DN8484_c0_g1_i1:100-756(+)